MGEIREGAAITLAGLTWVGIMGTLGAIEIGHFSDVRNFVDSYLSQVTDKGVSLGASSVMVAVMETIATFGTAYVGTKTVYKGISGN